MVKKNKTVIFVTYVCFFVLSEFSTKAENEVKIVQEKNVEVSLVIKDLIDKDCYSILLVPMLLNTIEDPLKDAGPPRLSSKKLAILHGDSTKNFLKLLSDCSPQTNDLIVGTQYDMIFLMKNHPTSEEFRIQVNIRDDRMRLNFNGFNIEATHELCEFINSLLLPLD